MWRKIYGHPVYVEDNQVKRATKQDHNGGIVPAYVYQWNGRYRHWTITTSASPAAVRAGMRRGTYAIM